jgi:hypothetical protein
MKPTTAHEWWLQERENQLDFANFTTTTLVTSPQRCGTPCLHGQHLTFGMTLST